MTPANLILTNESSVGIVGAGPAGLCAAANLLAAAISKITIFEQASEMGGQWRYSENSNEAELSK